MGRTDRDRDRDKVILDFRLGIIRQGQGQRKTERQKDR